MKNQFLMGVALAAALHFSGSRAEASAIRLVPSSGTVMLGSSFTLDVVAQNVNLGGFDITLGFNAGLVSLASVASNTSLGDVSQFEAFFSSFLGLDTVQVSEVSLLDANALVQLQGSMPGNEYSLALLTVDTIAAGSAEFTFQQTFLTGLSAEEVSADLIGATVNIQAPQGDIGVPEPGSLLLVWWGLFGIGMYRRRAR